jgi:hypothetical protein
MLYSFPISLEKHFVHPVAIPDQVTEYLIFGHTTQKEDIVNVAVITCRLLHTAQAFILNHFQQILCTVSHTIFVFVCHNSKHGTTQRHSHIFYRTTKFSSCFFYSTDRPHIDALSPFSVQCIECFTSRRFI